MIARARDATMPRTERTNLRLTKRELNALQIEISFNIIKIHGTFFAIQPTRGQFNRLIARGTSSKFPRNERLKRQSVSHEREREREREKL